MDAKTKSGYIAGLGSFILAALSIIAALNYGWNQTGQFVGLLGGVFLFLSLGSFWKPNLIGPITSQILENIFRNSEEREKISNKQSQKNTSILDTNDKTLNQLKNKFNELFN